MDIETVILIVAPPCSISMLIWVILFFSKSPRAKLIRTVAFKIWAIGFFIIIATVLGGGLLWRLKQEGTISLKFWGYVILLLGAAVIAIKFFWDAMRGN